MIQERDHLLKGKVKLDPLGDKSIGQPSIIVTDDPSSPQADPKAKTMSAFRPREDDGSLTRKKFLTPTSVGIRLKK